MVSAMLLDVAGFAVKAVLTVIAVVLVITAVAALLRSKAGSRPESSRGRLVVHDLTKELRGRKRMLKKALKKADPDERLKREEVKQKSRGLLSCLKRRCRAKLKAPKTEAEAAAPESAEAKSADNKPQSTLEKRRAKRQQRIAELDKKAAEGEFCPRNIFVLTFTGSVSGSEVKRLRREIDALLTVADKRDEVVVRLTSPGGMVNSYGLLSSQLLRIRSKGIFLTVCVDSVAASGGYLMACVANKIVAAPFAYIGSIGVVAEFPNFNRLLTSHEVDYEQVTAGKYKRTLTMLGPNTEEAREKFKEELEAIHKRFIEQVLTYRPQLDPERAATGEHWLAVDALGLGLVDELATSEEYLEQRAALTYGSVLSIALIKKKKTGLKALLGRRSLARALSALSLAAGLPRRMQHDEIMKHIH